MTIAVTAVQGTENPDDYWCRYTAQHTPDSARELAGKLRRFARWQPVGAPTPANFPIHYTRGPGTTVPLRRASRKPRRSKSSTT